jgi:hypothetical protein
LLVPLALSHELRSKEASPEEVEDAFRQAAVDVALDFVSYIPISLRAPETHFRAETVSRSYFLKQVMAVETSDGFRRSQSISLWALERFFVSRPT